MSSAMVILTVVDSGTSGGGSNGSNGSGVITGTNTVTGYASYDDFQALDFPQKITHGNLKKLTTDFGDGFTETVTTTYKAPVGVLTGLVDTVTTKVTSPRHGTENAPVKSYTYWNSTPLVATETTDAADNTLDLTTTYSRDNLGRVTITGISGHDSPGSPQHVGSYTTSQATAFDSRFDQPTTTKNAYGHATTAVYHDTLGLPTSVTDVNGAETTTTYDALGRVVRTRNELLGLQTDTTYAWTSAASSDWRKTQTVSPPSGVDGLAISSVFAIRTKSTAQPATVTYHDRLGRVIRTIKEGFNDQDAITDTVYNKLGQVVAASLPYVSGHTPLWTKTTYDHFGRVSKITAPNGTETTTTYAGRATAVTVKAIDREEQTNVTLVDAKGRTVKVWNADNAPATNSLDTSTGSSQAASIEYKLDGFGRMRETILKDQTQRIFATYDALGRQTTLDDPDKGQWHYTNNALGQVVSQTDAKGNVTTSTFDRLGRPLTRTTTEANNGPVETARWHYFDVENDTARHLVAKGNKGWIGSLQREESLTVGASGYGAYVPAATTAHYYDSKGRREITLRSIDGKWFYTSTVYDTYSRVSQINHYWRPAGDETGAQNPFQWENFGYTHAYDSRSYLIRITDTTPQRSVWWEAHATSGYDHFDRPVLVRKGGAHWTQRTYRAEDGVLTAIKTGPSEGGTVIQNLSYDFDGLGNLKSRGNGTHSETFGYDNLNRLTKRNGNTIATYADNGNITGKVDVSGNASGSYAYSPAKPHAVTDAWGYTMTYDANGNLSTRTGNGDTWVTQWTGFDKPRWMAKTSSGGTTVGSEFLYNANRSRVAHLEFDQMAGNAPSHYARKKIYAAGPDVEIDYKNESAEGTSWTREKVRVYVNAPDGSAGTMEYGSGGTGVPPVEKALVYHLDHLGSIESITEYGATSSNLALDDSGKPSRYSYDPWGERRNPETWLGKPVTTDAGGSDGTASRGYTGHEMLDNLELVHMNGRIYDAMLGKMLSADILVSDPANRQCFNRYGYVRNNPLAVVDPSGFLDMDIEYSKMRVFERDDGGSPGEKVSPFWRPSRNQPANPIDRKRGSNPLDWYGPSQNAERAARAAAAFVGGRYYFEWKVWSHSVENKSGDVVSPQTPAVGPDSGDRITDLRTAHVKAINTLTMISKNGLMGQGREDHILIREKIDKDGKYYVLSRVILGGPEPSKVPDSTMEIIAGDKSVVGLSHLHFNGGWLSGGDFRSAIAYGISISAVDTLDNKAEVFISNFDRNANERERWNFAVQWQNNYRNSTSGPGEWRTDTQDFRFRYAPEGYKNYIPNGSYYNISIK